MNILFWILFGLVIEILANTIDSSRRKIGLVGSVLLGIVGALAGGFLANLIFGISVGEFDSTAFLIAIAGSLIILFVSKSLRRA